MSTPELEAKKKRRIFFCGALCLLGAYLGYTAARTSVLLKNANRLIAHAEKFPREYSVGQKDATKFVCVVLGDSTAVGVGTRRWNESYAFQLARAASQKRGAGGVNVRVINIAVSGAMLNNVLEKQLPKISKLQPDLIAVSIGANDATHFTSATQYQKQIALLIAKLKASKARVLFANTPDMAQVPALPLPLALAVNQRAKMQNAILEKSIIGSQIEIVDLFRRGKLVYSQNPDLYAADFFHPSPQGYEIWAQLFINRFAKSVEPRA